MTLNLNGDSVAAMLWALIYGVLTALMALVLSWILLSQFNFFYGFWHDRGGIAEGIEKYGPQNRFRQGFAETTRSERIRIFAAINRAIHKNGEGLEDIVYRLPKRGVEYPLLRKPEIVHLQDVAVLIQKLIIVSAFVLFIWLGLSVYLFTKAKFFPSLGRQFIYLFVGLLGFSLVVFLIGPVKVFNTLHIWIFPADHQWFFYYQDSLMSTMMLAPVLFGWIAAAWLVLSAIFFVILAFSMHKLAGYSNLNSSR